MSTVGDVRAVRPRFFAPAFRIVFPRGSAVQPPPFLFFTADREPDNYELIPRFPVFFSENDMIQLMGDK